MPADQTPAEYLRQNRAGLRGTGVFLSLLEGGGTFISFKKDLTYVQAKRLGERYAAFKWIPYSVAGVAAVMRTPCRTPGEPCKLTCPAYGCMCSPETKTCVDASQNGEGDGRPSGKASRPGAGKKRVGAIGKRQDEVNKDEDDLVLV